MAVDRASWFERFMFRRVPLWVLLLCTVLGFAAMICFGALILHASRGGKRFQTLGDAAVALADTPNALRRLFNQVDPFSASPGTGALPAGFWANPSDSFRDPGYLLLPLYDASIHTPFVQLLRLSDGHVLREYRPDIAALTAEADRTWTPTQGEPHVPFGIGHPELLPDGGLLFNGRSQIVRTGPCGEIRWTAPGFHHSIERDADGNYWVPSVKLVAPAGNVNPTFREDSLTRIDLNGRRLFERSSGEIFAANGLDYLVHGRPNTDDPYHLNDIQPVMEDGPYWRRGDLFLSYRHQSLVMLYRPSTGRVLWWRSGPWLSQHDVTLLDDHRIGLFDNHVAQGAVGDLVVGHNRFIDYDFASNRWSSPYDAGFHRWNIRSVVGGRALHFSNGDLVVEDTNGGQVLRMDVNGQLRWRFVHGDSQGGRYRLSGARYLDPSMYGAALAAAVGAHCQ